MVLFLFLALLEMSSYAKQGNSFENIITVCALFLKLYLKKKTHLGMKTDTL